MKEHTIRKEDITDNLVITLDTLSTDVLPVFKQLLDYNRDAAHIDVVKQLGKLLKVSNTDVLTTIYKDLNKLTSNRAEVIKAYETLSKVITEEEATSKDIYLKNMATTLSSVITYSSKLIIFILDQVLHTKYNKPITSSKADRKDIDIGVTSFANALLDARPFIQNPVAALKEVRVVNITKNTDISILKSLIGVNIFSNFIGNVIFHIRLWVMDYALWRNESMKEDMRIAELKLLELKSGNVNDPKVQKQIEYYEDKVASLEEKISQFEDN